MTELEQTLQSKLSRITGLDAGAMEKARARQAELAKPPGSLGLLEDLSVQLAGITGQVKNELSKTRIYVLAADNGVVDEGVSSAPQSVTKQQTINLTRGKTGAAVLAKHFGCGLTVCDVGVNADIYESTVLNRKIAYGTQNICTGPAMTREQTLQAILTGAEIARTVDADVIGVGEMGIGNTTTSSAVLAVLLGADVEAVTGRGGGITEESFRKKKAVIRTAIEVNRPDRDDVVGVLSKVGGFDLAAMCGAFLGAAAARRPAVIDGLISAAAALFHYSKALGIPALVIAALVGFSRLYLFVHFPTDVLAGAVIGVILAVVSCIVTDKIAARIKSKKAVN